jgi:hypothetical protein
MVGGSAVGHGSRPPACEYSSGVCAHACMMAAVGGNTGALATARGDSTVFQKNPSATLFVTPSRPPRDQISEVRLVQFQIVSLAQPTPLRCRGRRRTCRRTRRISPSLYRTCCSKWCVSSMCARCGAVRWEMVVRAGGERVGWEHFAERRALISSVHAGVVAYLYSR